MFTVLQESRLQAEANLLEREVIHSVDSWITMILILTIYFFPQCSVIKSALSSYVHSTRDSL